MEIKDVSVNQHLGCLTIELYDSIVPKTAFNFQSLCNHSEINKPGYRGTTFFRIIPGLFCLSGDIEFSNGLGGMSVYDERYFDDENYILSHNAIGKIIII